MEFEVVKLTKTSAEEAKNKIIVTIANATVVDLGFAKQTIRKRFCLGVDSTKLKVGDSIDIDLENFDEYILESEVVDQDSGELTTIRTKWLKIKGE